MARKIGIILLVFVAFYLGAHFWIRWRNTVTDDVTRVSNLADCDPNGVREIKIFSVKEGKENLLAFERVDKPKEGMPIPAQLAAAEWKMVSPKTGEADASLLTRIANTFCEIYDPIPVNAGEYSAGAAAVDRMVVRVEGKSAGEHTVRFGKVEDGRMNVLRYQPPSGSDRYVKVPQNLLQLASLKAADYLNMRVLRMTADNISVVSVFSGAKEKFTLEREGEGWRLLVGGKLVGQGSENAVKYVNRLATLRAIKVDEEALSPAACEQSGSRMRAELQGVGGRKETAFFQYGKTGLMTVCDTARDALFSVHRDFIPYLETPVADLIQAKAH